MKLNKPKIIITNPDEIYIIDSSFSIEIIFTSIVSLIASKKIYEKNI